MLPRRFYFDNALDDLFEDEGAKMKCDIYEKDNTYHVDMDLPGFKKEEIKVECNKGNLIVSAEKKHEEEEKDEKKKYLRRERVYGKYSRSFYLGDVDEENIEFIKNLNITDVESLTNQEIVDYAKLLRERVITSLLVLDNSHYNKMIDNGLNQANIRARLINQALVNVLQKAKKNVEFKVIERYISPKTYFNYLKNEVIVVKDLMFEEHADQQYLAVLAAEIISRYAYLSYYASMTKSLKIKLARGSGSNVDAVVVNIAEKYGEKILTKVVKLNFTDTKKVKAMLKERG